MYDIARDEWSSLPEHENFKMSFNLMPLLANRYILVVSQKESVMLDTKKNAWVKVEMSSEYYEELGGAVQIGVFPLPMHAYRNYRAARRHFQHRDYFEMIFFGGTGAELLSNVFHSTLTLTYASKTSGSFKEGDVTSAHLELNSIEKMSGNGDIVKLREPDRFFYN